MVKEQLLSITDISRCTGKDFKTIKKNIGDLNPVKIEGRKHLYNAPEVFQRLYSIPENEELNLTEERAKLTVEQRKKTALERMQLEGKLMDIDFVVLNYSKMAIALKAKLLSIPTKLAPELVNIEKPAVAMGILKNHIYEVLNEISSDQFSADIGVEVDKILAKISS